MKSITIPLKEAIVFEDKTYNELTLHPFKTKHLKYLPDDFFNENRDEVEKMNAKDGMKLAIKMIPLIAGLANVKDEVIGELCFNDLMNVMGELTPFLEKCLEIGKS